MELKIITTEEELLAEKESWTALCEKMQNSTPFQTWEWNYLWWKLNEPQESLLILKAYENKDVYGYAPLTRKDGVISFIGGRDMDYGRFVLAKKEMTVIELFLEYLLKQKEMLMFQEMASGDCQLHFMQKALETKKHYLAYRTTRTSTVDIQKYSDFKEYCSYLSHNMRNRMIKKGLKEGISLQQEEVTDTLLVEIQDIFSVRQDERGGSKDFSWAIEAIKALVEKNMLVVYMARKEETPIGFLVVFLHKNGYYLWLTAFNEICQEARPGQLLNYQVLKDAFEQGKTKVDFMRGDYDFKMRWECALDSNYTICIYRSRFARWKKKVALKWRPRLKKIVYSNRFLKRFYKKHAK